MASYADAWIAKYDNPQKLLVEAVRPVIRKADKRVSETIKWQAPTFARPIGHTGHIISKRDCRIHREAQTFGGREASAGWKSESGSYAPR